MLSVLLAVSTLAPPPGIEFAALTPCAPDKHAACQRPAQPLRDHVLPPGKRCHPDPSKAVGCREILIGKAPVRPAADVAAR